MSLRENRYRRRPGGCRPPDVQLKFSCPAPTLGGACGQPASGAQRDLQRSELGGLCCLVVRLALRLQFRGQMTGHLAATGAPIASAVSGNVCPGWCDLSANVSWH
jgi:hypothetical protein